MACDTSVITGKLGKVTVDGTLIARITQWSINPKLASTSEWGDSDSEGYTNRAPGRKDATFNAEGKFDEDEEVYNLFEPGDCAQVTLWMTTTLYYDFPRALCSEFNLTINVDTEEVVGWTSSWGADGKFTRPGHPDQEARTLPV